MFAKLLLVGALLAGNPPTWTDPSGTRIVFSDTMCDTPELIETLEMLDVDRSFNATVTFQGQSWKACWGPWQPGKVFLVDAQGNGGYIDTSEIK